MKKKKEFSVEIVEHIAVLGGTDLTTKELNRVSFDGREPKYDLRPWHRKPGEPPKPLKGMQLNDEEVAALKTALMQRTEIPVHDI